MANYNSNHSAYLGKHWKHARAIALRHAKYEDQEARRYGRTVTATMVHHIYPLADWPDLAYVQWNLLPLSTTSHNKMHDRITDEVTDLGKYWQQKRKKEFADYLQSKKK